MITNKRSLFLRMRARYPREEDEFSPHRRLVASLKVARQKRPRGPLPGQLNVNEIGSVDPRPLVLGMKRAVLLTIVFLLLAGLAAGLAWFHFVYKPEMIRGFIAAAPQPVSTVAVGEAKQDEWLPRAPAIGTFRAVKGVDVAPQAAGVIVQIGFESGQDVKQGGALVQIDDTVE